MMADPLLVKTSVTVRYTANDGFSNEQTFKIYPVDDKRLPPEQPFIDALEELARLTALFGFEDKALKAFNEARQRVFDWRNTRAPNTEALRQVTPNDLFGLGAEAKGQ